MKKRFLSVVLAVGLILSLVPCATAALPDDVTYYEQNPYTNAKLVGKDENGVYHYKITIAADKEKQSVPLLLGSLYANVTSSDKTVVGTTYDASCDAYLGKAPGTATVTLSLGVYQSSPKEPQAVVDVTVLSPEDFAAYTGDDATHAVKGHTHTMIERETVDNTRGKLLVRKICTECGYWYNWSYENLPDWTEPGTNPGTNPGTTQEPTPTPEPSVPPANVIPGVMETTPMVRTNKLAPTASSNINAQNYNGNTASPINSYLYVNEKGGLTRIELVGNYYEKNIVVEEYDNSFKLQFAFTFKPELPIWGGFYAGKDCNYMVFGQRNEKESDDVETIRVVKYSKNWTQRLGHVSMYGFNTYLPFVFGSLRFTEDGDNLYIRTCNEMYKSPDGKNHQANVMLVVRQSDMAIIDSLSEVEISRYGYVSHSFNQFVLIDQKGRIVSVDHGDAYPRAAILQRVSQPGNAGGGKSNESTHIISFPGETGENATGCTIGGFTETANGYVTAYSYNGLGKATGANRDIYLAMTDKELSNKTVKVSSGMDVSTPQLAAAGLDGGWVMWTERHADPDIWWYGTTYGDTLYYAPYDADGGTGAVKTAKAALSDCAPIQWNGKTVWYVTDNSFPTFYTLDASGISAHPVARATYEKLARANTQTVLLDGKSITLQAYALQDNYGGRTNYVKLRDIAYLLNGSAAQFSVDWKDGRIIIGTKAPYQPNGSEMKTPFSGDRAYREGASPVRIDGTTYTNKHILSIILTDDNGGDYTYFKLRDLGSGLGFNVSYINGQVVINTNEPYSDAQ